MTTTGPVTQITPARRHGWWWKVLLVGLLLWVVTVVITLLSEDARLIPTVLLLGSFLVPLAVLLFAAERTRGDLTAIRLVLAFTVGGLVGVVGAAILESALTPILVANLASPWWVSFGVGFVEELAKGIVFVVVALHVRPKDGYQGALLGATVGAGFAAFASAGQALTAALGRTGTVDLVSLVGTDWAGALLAPLGQVLWTAILGAAILAASRGTQRLRLNGIVLVAFVTVVLLHGLADALARLAEQQTALYALGLVVIAAISVLVLRAFARTPRVDAPPAPEV